MKYLFIWFCLGCSCGTQAQKIFYTSQDLSKPYTGKLIQEIHPHWGISSLVSRITVVYSDGSKQRISKDTLWGFEDVQGIIYRVYKGNFYRIEELGNIIEYIPVDTRYKLPLYSKTLDRTLYRTKQQARKDMLANQS